MTNEDRMAQVEQALAGMGDTHNLKDILADIEAGRMQSFVMGETWVITQILEMPRKRVLEIVVVAGDMDDAEKLYDAVLEYGRRQKCSLVRTFARHGWARKAKSRGWTNGYQIYLKDL